MSDSKPTVAQIARMLDLSAVQAQHNEDDVRALAACAKKYRCVAAFALPALTPLLVDLLAGESDIAVGGVVGFPSGGDTTAGKTAQARELAKMGCGELDMVINVGLVRSGQYERVREDIAAVREAAGALPLKVILECHYLSDDQIRAACEACAAAGAAYVKTGTGWAPTGATPHNVALMHACVNGRCLVKAAGGIRDLATLLNLYRLGAVRFGVGINSAQAILKEAAGGAASSTVGTY